MLPPSIANRSLEELGALKSSVDWDSPVGERIRALRGTRIRDFTSEDLAFLLRQGVALQFIVPPALEWLRAHPLTHRDYYPGVLLVAALSVDHVFWREHPRWRAELDEIAQRTVASLRGRSHKTQRKFHITLEALTEAYDTFAATTPAI